MKHLALSMSDWDKTLKTFQSKVQTHSNLKVEQWEPVTRILSKEITLIISCQLTRLGVAENLKVRKSAQKQGVTHNQQP